MDDEMLMQADLTAERLRMAAMIARDMRGRERAHKLRMMAAREIPAIGPVPLTLLANGDSWFDYPLDGNRPTFERTDIIAQLPVGLSVLNVAHWGDTSVDELSLDKQRRMLRALADPDNWLAGGKPDAILFSGGGNDIAGEQFCIYLDDAGGGLDGQRFELALGAVEASYRAMFAFRDQHAPGVPIFGHSYDLAIPTGDHPPCIGPWLRPSLVFRGYSDVPTGAAIVAEAMVRFRDRLTMLAAEPANDFTLVDTQGVLSAVDWANELHPEPRGFALLAARFVAALRVRFPGRI